MEHYLESKPRYDILDGLRGVAAIMVVAFHIFECYSPGPMDQIINHGYLAVDFFFALSGFVIAYAYDDRWGKMSTWDFFKRRIVRLHPMAVFGTLLCACFFYLNAGPIYSLVENTPWYIFLFLIIWCCTLIPVPTGFDIRGWSATNPINDPTWSLQFEYLANILYALIIRRLSNAVIALCCAVSIFFTLTLTFDIDLFGLLASRSNVAYSVVGGWMLTPSQIFIGLIRLSTPFFMGLLLARSRKFIRLNNGFIWCSLAIIAITAMPRIGGTESMWMNGAYEAFTIILLFPLILSIGAGSEINNRQVKRVCEFLGGISYPLYITHFAFLYMLWTFKGHNPDAPLDAVICACIGVFIAAICTAYASMKLYDIPVRKWLKKRWLQSH